MTGVSVVLNEIKEFLLVEGMLCFGSKVKRRGNPESSGAAPFVFGCCFALLLNDEELFNRLQTLSGYGILYLDRDLVLTRNKSFGVDESGKNETLT
jgi:hypothetical protein